MVEDLNQGDVFVPDVGDVVQATVTKVEEKQVIVDIVN